MIATNFVTLSLEGRGLGVDTLLKALVGLALVSAGVLAGWVASAEDTVLLALFAAVIAGAVIAFFPRALLVLTLVGGLVVAGLARLYVPQLQEVRWLIAIGALALGAYGLTRWLLSTSSFGGRSPRPPLPETLLWGGAFVGVIAISTLLNWKGLSTAVVGFKGYFQMWGLLLALAFIRWPETLINRLPALLLAVAWLQLPFALHQYLVLVPYRTGLESVVPVDIVAGTFGGQKDGGGANAVLAAFLLLVVAGLVSSWKEGVITGKKAVLFCLPLLAPIAINEAKVSLVYVIVIFGLLFARDAVERPLRFFTALMALIAVLALLASAFVALAPRELGSVSELVEFIYEGNVESSQTFSGELTRWGAVEYWAERHGGLENIEAVLLGHGVGTTRAGAEFGTPVFASAFDPDLNVGRLGATAVLWDSGVLGLVCVTGFFWAAFRQAGLLAGQYAQVAEKRAMFRAIQAGVAVFYLSFWHKNFFVFQVGYQTVLLLVFGYLAYWLRWHPTPASSQE